MSNVEPYPYTSGGFDQGQRLAYGPPDAGDNADVTNPALQPTDAQQASSFPPYVIQSSVRLAQMVRTRLGDVPAPFSCRVITDGAKWRFETPVEKIDNSTWQMVLTDGTTNTTTTPVLGTDYTVDFRSGTISFNQTPPAGQVSTPPGRCRLRRPLRRAFTGFLPRRSFRRSRSTPSPCSSLSCASPTCSPRSPRTWISVRLTASRFPGPRGSPRCRTWCRCCRRSTRSCATFFRSGCTASRSTLCVG